MVKTRSGLRYAPYSRRILSTTTSSTSTSSPPPSFIPEYAQRPRRPRTRGQSTANQNRIPDTLQTPSNSWSNGNYENYENSNNSNHVERNSGGGNDIAGSEPFTNDDEEEIRPVTRQLMRNGRVGDPDIGMQVLDNSANIRMGTITMTVSMEERQKNIVCFDFISNAGLSHWSKSQHDNCYFPEQLPPSDEIERQLKAVSSPTPYDINTITKLFTDINEINAAHPISHISLSILNALDQLLPRQTRQLEYLKDTGTIHNLTFTESANGNTHCSICLSTFKGRSVCVLNKCQHAFHVTCLTDWYKVKLSCPICRTRCNNLKIKLTYKKCFI